MEFMRIGDKLIDLSRIDETVRRILSLRSEGLSQQEVADRLKVDRTFISRLESMGSLRRGGKIGLLCFPVSNTAELQALADRYGVEERLILSNSQRWDLVQKSSGLEFFNSMMTIVERFRQCDTVLVFCSSKWNRLAEVLMDNQVITSEIAPTPVADDLYLDPHRVEDALNKLK